MATDELTDLMHAEPRTGGVPDLEQIHRLGRRRRLRSRVGAGAGVLVVGSLLAGVWWALPSGGGGFTVETPAASRDHTVTGLTAYEKKVLELPGSYEVDGTVVLSDLMPVGGERPPLKVVGTPVPLGVHGAVGPGYLSSVETAAPYQRNAPKGSQVVIDPGPVWLACMSGMEDAGSCGLSVVVKDAGGDFQFLYGLGSERFLRPGAPMEVFIDDSFAAREWSQSVIGGFDGDDTARVVIESVDGTEADATVDVGELSEGDTVFWAKLSSPAAVVRAYDASGDLLEEHRVRSCKGGVDCEVR